MSIPPIRRSWDRVATTALFLSNGIGFGIWAGNLPRLKEAQALSDAGLGLLLLAVSCGAVLAMPLAGWLAPRVGAGRLAACAAVIGPALICVPSLVSLWPALLASGFAIGMAMGTMDVAMNGHASAVEKGWRAPIMSSFHAGWSLGGLGGSAIAGALAAGGFSLPLSYALPVGLVTLLALPGFSQRTAKDAATGARFALPGPAMLGVAAVAALCFVAEGAVADWSGVFLRSVLGSDAAWAASGFGCYSLAMAAGRIGGDAVVKRAGPVAVVRYGGGLAALGFALFLAAPLPIVASVALVLVGLGLSNIVPIAFSAAGRLRGTTGVAMAASTGYASFMISPPLIGAVADAIGLRLALLLIVAAIVAIAGLARAVAASPARPAAAV